MTEPKQQWSLLSLRPLLSSLSWPRVRPGEVLDLRTNDHGHPFFQDTGVSDVQAVNH